MEAQFAVELTADEIQALIRLADERLDESGLDGSRVGDTEVRTAKGKLEQAFTVAESMGGC